MMDMENRQVQQGQEISWRDLTAEQMATVMQRYMVDPELKRSSERLAFEDNEYIVYPEWGELKRRIRTNDKAIDANSRDLARNLGGYVEGLLTYFFTFIAAMNEKEKENGINFQAADAVDELAKMYNLDGFCCRKKTSYKGGSTQVSLVNTFENSIAQIIPFRVLPKRYETTKEKTKAQKIECWKRILRYLADENAPTCQDEVEKVFDWLHGKNAEASKVGDERNMDSYDTCMEILKGWWEENGNTLLKESGLMREEPQAPQQTEGTTEPVASEPENAPPPEKSQDPLEGNDFAKEARDRIKQGVKQIIFTGAPGTGKTYAATLIARVMGTRMPGYPERYKLVQFHPSYDYTDFVEGLRPVVRTGEKEVRFVKLDGSFKAFCRKVADENKKDTEKGEDPKEKMYFFLIDEINRADLSKVFGELMFCLEANKRGKKVDTQYQNLPTYDIEKACDLTPEEDVFHGGFFIPDNVIVIGTMNDIDRSVESMDFALRRRFDWMEAVVDEKMLENALPRILESMDDAGELVKSVVKLNDSIESEGRQYGLTRQHFISQGQFANLPKLQEKETVKDYMWKYRLEPLLREYLRGEAEKDIDEFIAKCKVAFFDVV